MLLFLISNLPIKLRNSIKWWKRAKLLSPLRFYFYERMKCYRDHHLILTHLIVIYISITMNELLFIHISRMSQKVAWKWLWKSPKKEDHDTKLYQSGLESLGAKQIFHFCESIWNQLHPGNIACRHHFIRPYAGS